MNAGFKGHTPEEMLETYSRGRLSDEDCAPLEEHLLMCPICQSRLEQMDEYTRVVKAAARKLVHVPAICVRRFAPEFRTAATVLRAALPLSTATTLADVGFGFTTLVALGRVCVNTVWTWNGIPRLG